MAKHFAALRSWVREEKNKNSAPLRLCAKFENNFPRATYCEPLHIFDFFKRLIFFVNRIRYNMFIDGKGGKKMDQARVWREFTDLPPESQQQVADFIAFLRTRYEQNLHDEKPLQTNLADEPFIGMWRNRTDMQDTQTWVRDIRRQEWVKPE